MPGLQGACVHRHDQLLSNHVLLTTASLNPAWSLLQNHNP